MMKLPQFLKKVDELTVLMEHDELAAFVHEVARVLPEVRRDDFLSVLAECADRVDDDGKRGIPKDDGLGEIVSEIESVITELEEINEGEKCLDSEYNEEWDDWYNSDVDEILFSDPDHLLVTISRAIELVHLCIDRNMIDAGCRLAGVLCYIEVQAEGDYSDFDGSALDLNELYEHDLLSGSIENCLKECLYLTYMGNELNARAKEIFFLFDRFRYNSVCLEDVLQMGNHELPEFDAFLTLWIDYLGKQNGGCANRLITEAQSMVEDDFALLENARKYADIHPELYLQLLEMKNSAGEDEKMLGIGQEALNAISVELVIRSAVALKTAEYADRLCRFNVRERCWIEALRSNTSVINYMRIKFLPWNAGQYREEVLSIIHEQYDALLKAKGSDSYYSYLDGRQSSIDKKSYCVMMFFESDFEAMEKVGMSIKQPLGWSSTFMKEGIAFMLLLLYQGSLLGIQSGLQRMLGRAKSACSFSCEEFYKGTDDKWNKTDDEKFLEIFENWKDIVVFSEELADKWLKKIEKWIQQRTAGIMEANRRNYYGECAGFIAALGEVKESMGEAGGRNRLMVRYKREYNRRSAFQRELKALGMVDVR